MNIFLKKLSHFLRSLEAIEVNLHVDCTFGLAFELCDLEVFA